MLVLSQRAPVIEGVPQNGIRMLVAYWGLQAYPDTGLLSPTQNCKSSDFWFLMKEFEVLATCWTPFAHGYNWAEYLLPSDNIQDLLPLGPERHTSPSSSCYIRPGCCGTLLGPNTADQRISWYLYPQRRCQSCNQRLLTWKRATVKESSSGLEFCHLQTSSLPMILWATFARVTVQPSGNNIKCHPKPSSYSCPMQSHLSMRPSWSWLQPSLLVWLSPWLTLKSWGRLASKFWC